MRFVAPREVHEHIAAHPINRIDELPPRGGLRPSDLHWSTMLSDDVLLIGGALARGLRAFVIGQGVDTGTSRNGAMNGAILV